jgi:CsbD-like
MDWNRFEGNWKQFSGTVKEKWGKLTDDDLDVINGRREQGPLGHARLVKMCPLRRISLSRFWLEALQGAGSMSTL